MTLNSSHPGDRQLSVGKQGQLEELRGRHSRAKNVLQLEKSDIPPPQHQCWPPTSHKQSAPPSQSAESVEGTTRTLPDSLLSLGEGRHWATASCLLSQTFLCLCFLSSFPSPQCCLQQPSGGLFFSDRHEPNPKLPGRPAGKHSVKELFRGARAQTWDVRKDRS